MFLLLEYDLYKFLPFTMTTYWSLLSLWRFSIVVYYPLRINHTISLFLLSSSFFLNIPHQKNLLIIFKSPWVFSTLVWACFVSPEGAQTTFKVGRYSYKVTLRKFSVITSQFPVFVFIFFHFWWRLFSIPFHFKPLDTAGLLC